MKKIIGVIISIILVMAIIFPVSAFSTIAVKGIKLDKSKITLNVDQTYKLNVTLTPKNTTQKKLTYVTANKNIATIDATGTIKGVSKGTTTITVYTYNKKIFAKCNVSIENAKTTNAATVHHLKLMGQSKFSSWVKWEDREKFKVWKLYEEQLKKRNLVLEYELIVPEQYATVVQTRMAAANDLPDIMNISPLDAATAFNFGKNGTIIDIKSAIDKYSDGTINKRYDGALNFAKRLLSAPDGNIYWFASALTGNSVIMNDGKQVKNLQIISNAIRKDWLDKFGIAMPKTVDEWKAALTTFRDKDANGNGQKDEVLIFDEYSYSFFTGIAQWFGLVPDVIAFDPNSGKVVSPWYQPGVKDYFKLMSDLTKEGIFDTSLIGLNYEACSQKIADNKVSSLRSYAVATAFEELIKGNDKVNYSILGPLTAKAGITPLMLCDMPDNTFDKFAITKNCKDVEGAIKLFDYVFSDEFRNVAGMGIEGVDYKYNEYNDPTGIDNKLTMAQRYKNGNGGVGVFVQNTFLPRIVWPLNHASTVEEYQASMPNEKTKAQNLSRLEMVGYRPISISPFANSCYAFANTEEVETTNKYYTSLKTYSEELSMNLILGNMSLDKWDEYVKNLKALGLDEMIKVYQAQYDRFSKGK